MTDQTTPLRDRIAAALMDLGHPQWDAAEGADAVLAVLPAPADRAAVLREAADIAEQQRQFEPAYGARKAAQVSENVGILRVAEELRRMADEVQQDDEGLSGPCDCGEGAVHYTTADCPAELRRVADETATTETQAVEDPARIDRLRPEFFEHASVESIDVQIQRAQRQQRNWGNRERMLGILRQARLTQKEHGELPAAGARQDGAQPPVVSCSHDSERHGPEAGCIECRCTSPTGHETERQDGAQR